MPESPIEKWRKKLGLTQAELAELSGASQGHISQVENATAEIGDKLEEFLTNVGKSANDALKNQKEFMELNRKDLLAKIKQQA